jgi:hypothetical protein
MCRVTGGALLWVLAGTACELDQPCDDYVSYMCDCYGADTDFDCEELQQTYDNAGPDVQDQCAIELSAQQADDEQTGACD